MKRIIVFLSNWFLIWKKHPFGCCRTLHRVRGLYNLIASILIEVIKALTLLGLVSSTTKLIAEFFLFFVISVSYLAFQSLTSFFSCLTSTHRIPWSFCKAADLLIFDANLFFCVSNCWFYAVTSFWWKSMIKSIWSLVSLQFFQIFF